MATIAEVIEAAKTDEMVLVNIHSFVSDTDEYKALLATASEIYRPLVGTERQVAWAVKLRQSLVESLAFTLVRNRIANTAKPSKYGVLQNDVALLAATKRFRIVACQSKAEWYIQNESGTTQTELMFQAARTSLIA